MRKSPLRFVLIAGFALLFGCGPGLRASVADSGEPDAGADAGCASAGCCAVNADCPQPGHCNLSTGRCACDPGRHPCSGACVPDDSVAACGFACESCTAPPDATPVCRPDGCSFVCSAPTYRCGQGCCKAIAVTAGNEHSCLLTSAGGVKCWGAGGTIGNGTWTDQLLPVDVSGLQGGVAELSAGNMHTCARLSSGALKCWGINANGSVGDGTSLPRPDPVDVLGQGVERVAAGAFHTCALVDGGARCWGANTFGQLGSNGGDRPRPGDVSGLVAGVTALTSGNSHSCALTSDGKAHCWGFNVSGQCGDGTAVSPKPLPVEVQGLDAGVTALYGAFATSYALTREGGARCWGGASQGECGDGVVVSRRLSPVTVSGLSAGAGALATGSTSQHACALIDGGVRCWGANGKGQLGDGTVLNQRSPVDVFGLPPGVVSVAPGGSHTCAVTSAGGVKCWGSNNHGQLGDGSKDDHLTPVDVR
ncbi:MAG: RCC1 domain-containing protein [Myxococcaceae bacterium]